MVLAIAKHMHMHMHSNTKAHATHVRQQTRKLLCMRDGNVFCNLWVLGVNVVELKLLFGEI